MAPKQTMPPREAATREEPRVRQLLDALHSPAMAQYQALLRDAARVEQRPGGVLAVWAKGAQRGAAPMLVRPPVHRDTWSEIHRLRAAHRRLAADFVRAGGAELAGEMRRVCDEADALEQYDLALRREAWRERAAAKAELDGLAVRAQGASGDERLAVRSRALELAGTLRAPGSGQSASHFVAAPPQVLGAGEPAPAAPAQAAPAPKPKPAKKERPGAAAAAAGAAQPAPGRNDRIRDNVMPQILGRFPLERLPVQVRSMEECTSKSRSKAYYISKEDLIKAIDADAELQRFFGRGYKSKTKDQLCQIMFRPTGA